MMAINSKLREDARVQLEGKWGKPLLFSFLYIVISSIPTIFLLIGNNHPYVSSALQIIVSVLIAGSLVFGVSMYSLKFKRGEEPGVAVLFEGFKRFGTTLGLYLWYLLWTFLWTLLLIIPGIIKGISYSMCFYIMADNPEIGIRNALKISKKITKGYKGKIFVFYLSFIGWSILAMLTVIGYLWLMPYIQISSANLYDELKNHSIEKSVCTFEEFTEKVYS